MPDDKKWYLFDDSRVDEADPDAVGGVVGAGVWGVIEWGLEDSTSDVAGWWWWWWSRER
jgi:hypothetical protein